MQKSVNWVKMKNRSYLSYKTKNKKTKKQKKTKNVFYNS